MDKISIFMQGLGGLFCTKKLHKSFRSFFGVPDKNSSGDFSGNFLTFIKKCHFCYARLPLCSVYSYNIWYTSACIMYIGRDFVLLDILRAYFNQRTQQITIFHWHYDNSLKIFLQKMPPAAYKICINITQKIFFHCFLIGQ
jgi:hypothetical protein